MNHQKFQFQDPGEGIHEAEVLEVLVSEGDQVREGQDVVVVETDKAAFELAAPRSGRIGSVDVSAGDMVKVGDTLLTFEDATERGSEGEDERRTEGEGEGEHGRRREGERERERKEAEAREDEEVPGGKPRHGDEPGRQQSREPREPLPAAGADRGLARGAGAGRAPVPATPATRRLARELGVDLTQVSRSGEDGRVLDDDVRAFAAAREHEEHDQIEKQHARPSARAERPPVPDRAEDARTERLPLRSVRRKIAERMTRAWQEIPHVTHHDLLDITQLEQWRQRLAPRVEHAGGKLTLTVLVLKALCANLREFPTFNASLDAQENTLVIKHYYDVGVAVDTPRGLLVPVVRDAASKNLAVLSRELVELAERARTGQSSRNELMGSTFTITNVGSLGGSGFTPIINYPEVAILGLARARQHPVVVGAPGEQSVTTQLMLPVSLAFDHRVIDGAQAARFVTRLGQRLADLDEFVLSL